MAVKDIKIKNVNIKLPKITIKRGKKDDGHKNQQEKHIPKTK